MRTNGNTLFVASVIHTMNDKRPTATSMLVDPHGVIIGFDLHGDGAPAMARDARLVDLPKGTVTPCLFDGHNHPGIYSMLRSALDLIKVGAKSAMDALRMIRNHLDATTGGLIVVNWNTGLYTLTQSELDAISGDERSILVIDKSFHAALASTAAMKQFRFPLGVHGTLHQGLMTEGYVIHALGSIQLGTEVALAGLEAVFNDYLSLGIGGARDLLIPSQWLLDMYREGYQSGRLRMPVAGFVGSNLIDDGVRPFQAGNFNLHGMKGIADGALGSHTAAVMECWADAFADAQGNAKGLLLMGDNEWTVAVARAAEVGFSHFALHAIGDRAVFEAALGMRALGSEIDPTRCSIEHALMLDERQLAVLGDRGYRLSMQPNFPRDDGDLTTGYRGRLGLWANRLGNHQLALDQGYTLVFGSDGMPTEGVRGILAAVDRRDDEQDLQIPLAEAWKAYTLNPAIQAGMGDTLGSLAPGKRANFAVWAGDPVQNLADLRRAERPLQTWMGGSKVYEAARKPF